VGKAVIWKLMPDLTRTLQLNLNELNMDATVISRELELTYPEHRFIRFYMVPFEIPRDLTQDRQYAVILTDITEEKISTEERIEDEKTSSVFMLAASVAHEIGNPLNAINIHLQIIKRKLKQLENGTATEKIASAVDVCTNEVDRLDSIVKHFLEAIRPTTPLLGKLNLLSLLEEVLEIQSEELKDLGISIDIVVNEDLPIIMADAGQIKQVFFNIIKNAMEAMDAGGQLKISTHSDDDYVFLYFADTGVGISTESMGRVFLPYFSTKDDGHGLGMMIVQRIMREHGGQIGIDSKENTGTIVTLQFPQQHRRMRMIKD